MGKNNFGWGGSFHYPLCISYRLNQYVKLFPCPVDPTFVRHGCSSWNISSDTYVFHYLLISWILTFTCHLLCSFCPPWLDFLTTDLLFLPWDTYSGSVTSSFYPCSDPPTPMHDWLRVRTYKKPYSQANFADQSRHLGGILKNLE